MTKLGEVVSKTLLAAVLNEVSGPIRFREKKMISEEVLKKAPELQSAFQTATPFKHLCIDNFLDLDAAEQALSDFPAFDRNKAIDEYGNVGRKAVFSNLGEISPFYARLYKYLFSAEFLAAMSKITGIPDLIGDPTLYGGGTHENLHGQELDPHVDFNYVAGGNAHRRVNLLIYLNKGWDSAWGGDIEIHSNPREPDTNEIKAYRVDFNRAVLFETNEYSWHGFPQVNLPEALRDKLSRKCISIYLYSATRPVEEITATHGTFYVQRPMSNRFVPGYVLTQADISELKSGYANRDHYIAHYQQQEIKLNAKLADNQQMLEVDHKDMNQFRRSWFYGAIWTLIKLEAKLRKLELKI